MQQLLLHVGSVRVALKHFCKRVYFFEGIYILKAFTAVLLRV